jgi:CheY-like chemotaxis protein
MKKDHIVFLAEDDLDDEEMLVEVMQEECETVGFVTAHTGSKALEALKNFAPNELPCLVLLDYNLPEMSGAEILARLKDLRQFDKVVKVVWSTSNSPVYQKKCMELGAHSYIVKPTGIAGIREIAKQLLEICISPA